MNNFLSFKLSDDFVNSYNNRKVEWGLLDAGGTSFSEIVFLRTYSRLKDDGTKETWQDVCRRVVEGTYSIQKDWVKQHHLKWNDHKAARSAQEMFDRMFHFKWTPPGRGQATMGTPMVNGENGFSTSLQNCGAVALGQLHKNDPGEPFAWLMGASMLGVGIGYSTIGIENLDIKVQPVCASPEEPITYVVPDSREGWAESTHLLINSFLVPNQRYVEFDYSLIRPKGALINSFKTPAPGPEPLRKLHDRLRVLFDNRVGQRVDDEILSDIANLIGKCVVSGNTRRSALLAYGELTSPKFVHLKNYEKFPERTDPDDGWAWMSNNSVRANVFSDLTPIIDSIKTNGEPGVIWEDVVKSRGRLVDAPDDKDARFVSFNPCSEQPLENREFCTLADVYVNNHTDQDDFKRTLKFAFLYAKTVTLLPTHFEDSNAVMQRNRRIGLSLSGITDFIDERPNGLQQIRSWFASGYDTIRAYDKSYSEWLCVRESNRVTTIKPGGTTGVECATSSGIHWTDGGRYYMRALRLSSDDPMIPYITKSGHIVEPDRGNPDTTVVAYFPIKSRAKRSARQVSLFEKAALAVEAQRLWSDNGVSVTLTFDAEREADDVATVLNMYAGQLKAVSFLPIGNAVYPQQPYTEIDEDEYNGWAEQLSAIPMKKLYSDWNGGDIVLEGGCTTDVCEIKWEDTGGN